MKKLHFTIIALTSIIITLSSCKKEPEKTVAEKLAGKWTTANQYLQGNKVASADGSYLEFNSNESGNDHKGSDNTSGTFTWKLQNSDAEILFADTTSKGGFWNGAYTIVTITDSRMTIKAATLLGEYKCDLTK